VKNFNNLTLIIPAKQEHESLPLVIEELKKYKIKKIVVIPKNENYDYIKDKKIVFLKQKNKGYGDALIFGIHKVKTDFFCIFNADGSFRPMELRKMLDELKRKKLNFIFASRYKKNGKTDDDTILTAVGNFIFTKLSFILFSTKISDILYTYVLGKTKSFKKLKIKSNDFSFCVELPIKIQKANMKYSCIASHERRRLSGTKKVNEFRDGIKIMFKMIFLLLKKN
jgi:glycosyltransferase involved in cell wall biosynthesis